MRRAWVLNLGADEELARPGAVTRSAAVQARIAALGERLVGLVPPEDAIVDAETAEGAAEGSVGRAWCPTPDARRAWQRAGVIAPAPPPFEVLRAANHRRFSATLGQRLPGAGYADDEATVRRLLTSDRPRWLLKRPFGYRGTGRRAVTPTLEDTGDTAWLRASLRAGEGLQVEPWVEITADYGLHGHLTREGRLTEGEITRQLCDPRGAWIASERAIGDLAHGEDAALRDEVRLAASALTRAGYHGPFGVDAFRWRDEAGRSRFCARCEINARYSMGWAIGMGDRRPDLDGDE